MHEMQFLPITKWRSFNFQFLILCCHLDEQNSCVGYCNAVFQNCSDRTDGSFRHIFTSSQYNWQTYKNTIQYMVCQSVGYWLCRHISGAIATFKLLLQTGDDYRALQLCNCNIVQCATHIKSCVVYILQICSRRSSLRQMAIGS